MSFSISYTYQVLDRFSKPLNRIARKSKVFERNMRSSTKAADKFSKKMLSVGAGVAAVGGIMIAKDFTKSFISFEEQLNKMSGMTKATGNEFQLLAEKAKFLGATTQFTATETAEGINMLGRNSLTATQILGGAIEAALLLSSATGSALANSADIATDAMANFNFKAADLGDVVNQIAGTTLNSKFSIDDYRLALGQAGGVAGKVGVSFSDFNTTIAATAPLFASGAGAGTSFKTFLQRLVPSSKEAKRMMKRMNLEFFDGAGKMKNMADISEMMKKSFDGLTEKQLNHVTATIFGTDAMRTAIGIAGAGRDKFRALAGEIEKVSAKKLAADRMRGLTGAVKAMKSAWEGLQIAMVGSGVDTILTMVANTITLVIRSMSKLPRPVLFVVSALAGMVAVLAPLMVFFGTLAALWPALVAGAAMFGTVMAVMTGPIGLIVMGIAALIAGITFLIANWDKVSSFFGFGGGEESVAAGANSSANTLNGQITVAAEAGTKVKNSEMSSSAGGNLGMNMAPVGA